MIIVNDGGVFTFVHPSLEGENQKQATTKVLLLLLLLLLLQKNVPMGQEKKNRKNKTKQNFGSLTPHEKKRKKKRSNGQEKTQERTALKPLRSIQHYSVQKHIPGTRYSTLTPK